jgi:hypothetical protein
MKLQWMASVAFGMIAVTAVEAAQPVQGARRISLRSGYLAAPLGQFRQFTLTAELAGGQGSGVLTLDPNTCTLDEFGDPAGCTRMAVTKAQVQLTRLRIADPRGQNRQLWTVSGSPLSGTLTLAAPASSTGPHRLIHTTSSGKLVVPLEAVAFAPGPGPGPNPGPGPGPMPSPGPKPMPPRGPQKCSPLARRVDGVEARVAMRPGPVAGSYVLTLTGKKPHQNTTVELKPVTYIRAPEYWLIDVQECREGDILLPAVSPYRTEKTLTAMGSRGIELRFANGEIVRLPRP